jgi:hypothetical protein
MPRLRVLAVCLLFAAGLLLAPARAGACSICRCSDPTFTALGTNGYSAGEFHLPRLGPFQKSQATEEGNRRGDREPLPATFSYSSASAPARRATSVLPRDLRPRLERCPVTKTFGSSDPSSRPRRPGPRRSAGLGRRAWISAIRGQTPGDERRPEGRRALDSTRSRDRPTDLGGFSGFYLDLTRRSSCRRSTAAGRNDFGYKYGDNVIVSTAYERKRLRSRRSRELNSATRNATVISGRSTPTPAAACSRKPACW